YSPIAVLVNIDANACPSANSQAKLTLNGSDEAFSSDVTPIAGACPGGSLTLNHGTRSNFVPPGQGVYVLTVTNSSKTSTTDLVELTNSFPAGLSPVSIDSATN